MRVLSLVLPLLFLASASAAGETAPSPAPTASPKAFAIERWSYGKEAHGATPIKLVVVHNDFGDVRVRKSDGEFVEALAVMQRLGSGPDVGMVVERRGEVLSLTAAFPPGRVQDADTPPAPDAVDRLDLSLLLPDGVALEAHTLGGLVEAQRLKVDVTAESSSGAIVAITTGRIQARTDSGKVVAVQLPGGPAGRREPLLLQSRTGTLDLTLPDGPAYEVRAETAGKLESEFELLKPEKLGERLRLVGSLGTPAGREALLWSETGSVVLRKAAKLEK